LAGGNILAKLDRQLHGLGDVDAELVKVVAVEEITINQSN